MAISFSDGGRRVESAGSAQGDEELSDLEADVSLHQVDALAKEFGGAATVRSAPTGRNVAKTIVTIYIPQYSSKPDPGTHPLAARMLTTHYQATSNNHSGQ